MSNFQWISLCLKILFSATIWSIEKWWWAAPEVEESVWNKPIFVYFIRKKIRCNSQKSKEKLLPVNFYIIQELFPSLMKRTKDSNSFNEKKKFCSKLVQKKYSFFAIWFNRCYIFVTLHSSFQGTSDCNWSPTTSSFLSGCSRLPMSIGMPPHTTVSTIVL